MRKTFEAVEAVKTVEAGGSVLNVLNVLASFLVFVRHRGVKDIYIVNIY